MSIILSLPIHLFPLHFHQLLHSCFKQNSLSHTFNVISPYTEWGIKISHIWRGTVRTVVGVERWVRSHRWAGLYGAGHLT